MNRYWREDDLGLFFAGVPDESCQQERLEMLYFEGIAKKTGQGYLLSYDIIASLSEADAELFALPELNPYRIYVTADGTQGHRDLRYSVSILKPDGDVFINPVIHGCILHIDAETEYRLDVNQYKLVRVTSESNQTVPTMERRDLPRNSLINLSSIQKYAMKSETKLDKYISPDNQMIVVPDKLDVEFIYDGGGSLKAAPIILKEDNSSALDKKDEESFQEAFSRSSAVTSIYQAKKDGKTIKYVFKPDIKRGLEKIKEVNRFEINSEDAERYKKQPKELFGDETCFVFGGTKNTSKKENDQIISNVLPNEGEFVSSEYSDRVTGISPIKKSVYYDGGAPHIEWILPEGIDEIGELSVNEKGKELERKQEEQSTSEDKDSSSIYENELKESINEDDNERSEVDAAMEGNERNSLQALDITPNFASASYTKELKPRNGALGVDALREGIVLYDYQKDAVEWMYTAWKKGYSGVLLADDMGLGKTLQALAFLAGLKRGTDKNVCKPVLIVGPTALLANWESEYYKFVKEGIFDGILPLHGYSIRKYQTGKVTPNGKKKLELKIPNNVIALTTYETLRDYQFSFAEVNWWTIIADEAQKIKNPTTGITTAVKAMKYDYAICLSGTPVENSWIDIWSIMDFVSPAKLGSLQKFKEEYINQLKCMNGQTREIEKLGRKLKEKLNPLFMRRMKNDKLEGLPRKVVHICPREMPLYQKKRYFSIIKEAEDENTHPLAIIAKLRDISLHPDIGIKSHAAFYDMNPEDVINQSARLITTFKLLQGIQERREKVLIFVVSKKMQLILMHLVKAMFGIPVYTPINGEMNGAARQRIIDKFNSDYGFGVLILSPEAAGVGFTITSANNVIHLSRTWNPAKEEQATDRVYRIGQTKEVNVYIPLACTGGDKNSFDESLNELLEYKRQLSNNVLFPTGESFIDGQKIFNECVNNTGKNDTTLIDIVTIERTDEVTGDVFEEIITNLYNSMCGYRAIKTPHAYDNGADVVVVCDDGESGKLIQCKHRDNPSEPMGKKGVQEVFAAINHYKNNVAAYKGIDFKAEVVTNAIEYTNGAKELAASNGVRLIARKELKKMLDENPLPNKY